MTKYLLDTSAWFWLAVGDQRIPQSLVAQLEPAVAKGDVHLSQISPWEIAFKTSSGKIELNRPVDLWLRESSEGLAMLDLPLEVVVEATRLPGSFHKDPADRFIVATARVHDLTLVTGDQLIVEYAAKGHLKVIAV